MPNSDDYAARKQLRCLQYERSHGLKLEKCSACNGSGYYDHNNSPLVVRAMGPEKHGRFAPL